MIYFFNLRTSILKYTPKDNTGRPVAEIRRVRTLRKKLRRRRLEQSSWKRIWPEFLNASNKKDKTMLKADGIFQDLQNECCQFGGLGTLEQMKVMFLNSSWQGYTVRDGNHVSDSRFHIISIYYLSIHESHRRHIHKSKLQFYFAL